MGKENSTAKDTADPTSPKKRKKDTTQTSTISKPQSTVVATTTTDIYKVRLLLRIELGPLP